MVVSWISLLGSLAAIAYLTGWLFQQLVALAALGKAWWLAHRKAGRIAAMKPAERIDQRAEVLVGGMGILVGSLGAYGLSQVLSKEALLLGAVVLLILSQELQPVTCEKELLAVLVLIDRFRAHCLENEDPFDILTRILQELPEGKVQNSVREAVFRRRSGVPAPKCLAALTGIDPFLDEFILNLRLVAGSGSGPALGLILSRLQDRAGKKWDETSRLVLLKTKTTLPLRFGRAAMIAGACVLLIGSPWGWMPGFLSQLSWTRLVEVVMSLGLSIYLINTQKWARKILVILIPLFTLVFYGSTLKW